VHHSKGWTPKENTGDPRDNYDSQLPRESVFQSARLRDAGSTYKPAPRPFCCEYCGGRDFWQLAGGRWMCSKCRPNRKPIHEHQSIIQVLPITAAQPVISAQPAAAIFPESISYFPSVAVQATRTTGARGGYRLYLLAKALDEPGEGKIKRDDLHAYADHLGVSLRNWQRWINEARALDLLTDVQAGQAKGGDWYFIIASHARAAYVLKCETIGTRKANMPAALLIGEGWRAHVWAAYEKLFRERPVTREKLKELTNVPVSTQRYRDNQAGVKRVRSYAKSTISADQISGMKEYSQHKGIFVRHDGVLSWHLPNSYIVSHATIGTRGRARKANKILSMLLSLEGLSLERRALTSNNEPGENQQAKYRLFNRTPKQFKTTRKKIREHKPRVGDVYAFPKGTHKGALVWEHAHAATYLRQETT